MAVVDTMRAGQLLMPFHYDRGAQSANQHTSYARDAVSKQPQFKSSPVALRRLSFGAPEPWLLARRAGLNGEITEPFAARRLTGNPEPTGRSKQPSGS